MSMKHEKSTSVLSLLVFALFTLCLLLTVLTGARVYRQIVSDTQGGSDKRTKLQYLSTKVRQGQDISLGDFGGCDALILRETIDGENYVTYVYCHGGWLRELFCAEGASLSPEDGETVIRADSLTFLLENDLLTAQLDGETLYLSLHQKKAVRP